MRLLCPFCQQVITLPDNEAGKAVNCPLCKQAFQAPQPYIPLAAEKPVESPAPAPAPPSPAPVYRTQQVDIKPVTPASLPEMPSKSFDNLPDIPGVPTGPGVFHGITLYPEVLAWIPAVALTLALLLTFFRWAGAYPAGYPAYTQTPWQALFAGFTSDAVAEDTIKLEGEIKEKIKSNWWMLFYFPLLLGGIAVAWAGPVVSGLKIKLPDVVKKFWPYRPALLAIFAVFTLLLLSVQWVNSFGIEKAITELGEARHVEAKAAVKTPEQLQRWEMGVARDLGGFQLQTTSWLRLAWFAHLLAALAVGLEAVGTLRGKRPPIRVGIQV
ncbi:hypothetical protein [Zavarzinella formosa]|uniref:hypothetical protein n=1 Tax=Zavarzinella formosa TaxID=360055 RepID=UPI0003029D98|nr:hypothetical protein [Zavarzinella formosa]